MGTASKLAEAPEVTANAIDEYRCAGNREGASAAEGLACRARPLSARS